MRAEQKVVNRKSLSLSITLQLTEKSLCRLNSWIKQESSDNELGSKKKGDKRPNASRNINSDPFIMCPPFHPVVSGKRPDKVKC